MAGKIRVLLVDDDPDFIEANSIILDASGFEVLTASSGAEGLKRVEEEKPDVVVLDVMMENTDEGFSVARKIRRQLNADFFPVNQFLEKPVPPTILVQKIREALEKGK